MDTYLSKFAERALMSAPVFSQVLPFTSGIPSDLVHQKHLKNKISIFIFILCSGSMQKSGFNFFLL